MPSNLGFSYVGFIFLLCLFIPNILYGLYLPIDNFITKENKILMFFERIGQVSCTLLLLILNNLDIYKDSLWSIWLGLAVFLMILYIFCWLRYFVGGHISIDLYRSFLGIPIPLAVLPIISMLLLSIYGKEIWLIIASIFFGIGHIGISTQNWIALKKNNINGW